MIDGHTTHALTLQIQSKIQNFSDSTAWSEIPNDMTRKAFKKCCFSNALDESEDVLWFR